VETDGRVKQKPRGVRRGAFVLSCYEREKSHKASAFYCESELSLVRRGHICPLLAQDSRVRIHELLEDFRILVVDVLYIMFFEETLFAHND